MTDAYTSHVLAKATFVFLLVLTVAGKMDGIMSEKMRLLNFESMAGSELLN
jgi:hypothetical protein